MSHLRIVLSLPHKAQAIHANGHWRSKAGPTKAHRLEAKYLTMEAIARCGITVPVEQIIIDSTWYMARTPTTRDRYRPLDIQNAIGALKAAFDGIVDAGLVVSDNHNHLLIGSTELLRSAKRHQGRACVELNIEILESRTPVMSGGRTH